MSKIIENLYLGNIDDVHSTKFITDNNIKLIINAAIEVSVPTHENVNLVMNLQWYDSLDQPIGFCYLDHLADVIDSFLKENEAVLVNCFAGISRSSTIVIAYMMKYHNMRYIQALDYVRNRRFIINPNPNFRNILNSYEQFLFNKSL